MHTRPSFFTAAVVALTISLTAAAQQRDAAAPTTVKDVMVSMTVPASNGIFDAQADPPDTDAKWAAMQKAAVQLAESGRLLTRDPLAKDQTTWLEMARALVTEAERAAQVAAKKDREALDATGDAVYATCETCHSKYMAQ